MFTESQLELIVDALSETGYCVLHEGVSSSLSAALLESALERKDYRAAGVGRNEGRVLDAKVRGDELVWIDGDNESELAWIDMMSAVQQYLNRSLYLGLFSFESHFAHYVPGAYYEKHRDAFKGQSNRVVSCVTYLNSEWRDSWGGELVIYSDDGNTLIKVLPERGTVVLFLSEEFPHEVLPATKDRYSIAGWFRVNGSQHRKVDPSR